MKSCAQKEKVGKTGLLSHRVDFSWGLRLLRSAHSGESKAPVLSPFFLLVYRLREGNGYGTLNGKESGVEEKYGYTQGENSKRSEHHQFRRA